MRNLLNQIRMSLDSHLFYMALFVALTLPDICGAIESENGEASSEKYIRWFNTYISPRYNGWLTGEDCYQFRCSLLHQGTSQHPRARYARVIFVEPTLQNIVMHCNILNDALNLDLNIFCRDVIMGVEQWLQNYEGTNRYNENYSRFMRRYPEGLAPYIVGIPVIS